MSHLQERPVSGNYPKHTAKEFLRATKRDIIIKPLVHAVQLLKTKLDAKKLTNKQQLKGATVKKQISEYMQ